MNVPFGSRVSRIGLRNCLTVLTRRPLIRTVALTHFTRGTLRTTSVSSCPATQALAEGSVNAAAGGIGFGFAARLDPANASVATATNPAARGETIGSLRGSDATWGASLRTCQSFDNPLTSGRVLSAG